MLGKHTKEALEITRLKRIIERKDRELLDVKTGCRDEFRLIKQLCNSNEYNGKFDKETKLKKIYEIATDNENVLTHEIREEQIKELDSLSKTI